MEFRLFATYNYRRRLLCVLFLAQEISQISKTRALSFLQGKNMAAVDDSVVYMCPDDYVRSLIYTNGVSTRCLFLFERLCESLLCGSGQWKNPRLCVFISGQEGLRPYRQTDVYHCVFYILNIPVHYLGNIRLHPFMPSGLFRCGRW